MPTLPANVNAAPPHHPLPPHLGYMPHPLPPLAHAGFDVTDSDPASSVASPSGASSCSYGSSLLPPRFEDFLSSGPTASEIFIDKMEGLVDDTQLLHVLDAQRHMLTRFEKTNEMLLNFNALSATRYENAAVDFRRHTALLLDMKRELDNVFRRIRALKSRLGKAYPEAFRVCSDVYNMDDLLEEEEEEDYYESSRSMLHSDASLVGSQESQPPHMPAQPVVPDLRRRRSRSFPNSSFVAALASADLSAKGPLGAVDVDPEVVVKEDDQIEEVNVRSHQPVPEGESPPPPCAVTRRSAQRGDEKRIGDSEKKRDEEGKRDNFSSSRQVYSHEERPCASVNYVTSSSLDVDSGSDRDGSSEPRQSSTKQLRKSESVGTVSKTTAPSDAETFGREKLDSLPENDADEAATSSRDARQKHSKGTMPQRPQSQQPPSTHQQKNHQPHKLRPKSHPKTSDSQDEGSAYDVTLSKMASETHRFISEGVAAAAAAAVDAVLTHTAGAAAAAAASGKDGAATGVGGNLTKDGAAASSGTTGATSTGKKVKPGYGIYQPPKRRGGSLEEKAGDRQT